MHGCGPLAHPLPRRPREIGPHTYETTEFAVEVANRDGSDDPPLFEGFDSEKIVAYDVAIPCCLAPDAASVRLVFGSWEEGTIEGDAMIPASQLLETLPFASLLIEVRDSQLHPVFVLSTGFALMGRVDRVHVAPESEAHSAGVAAAVSLFGVEAARAVLYTAGDIFTVFLTQLIWMPADALLLDASKRQAAIDYERSRDGKWKAIYIAESEVGKR